MKDPTRFDRWVCLGVGIFFGGFMGATWSVVFCNWLYAGSGAGIAGGGDGIETVIAGWVCFGTFGAMVGALIGGILGYRAIAPVPGSAAKKPSQADPLDEF